MVNRKMNRPELDGRYMQALHFQARNKHRIAVQVLREILIVDPVYEKAYTALGVSHDALGDFERAETAYRMALQLNPDLDYVHNNLGIFLSAPRESTTRPSMPCTGRSP